MAQDRYSRMVQLLKVILPLAALTLLSAVFLLSRGVDLGSPIPFAEDEIVERTRDQQVTGPFFSGVTPQGEQIQVQAKLARPGGPDSRGPVPTVTKSSGSTAPPAGCSPKRSRRASSARSSNLSGCGFRNRRSGTRN